MTEPPLRLQPLTPPRSPAKDFRFEGGLGLEVEAVRTGLSLSETYSLRPDREEDSALQLPSRRFSEQPDVFSDLPGVTEAHIRQAFSEIDFDGNGFIGVSELRYLLVVMGERPTDDDLDEMLRMLDNDGDGQVSYEEFLGLFREGSVFRAEMLTMEPEESLGSDVMDFGDFSTNVPTEEVQKVLLDGAAGFMHAVQRRDVTKVRSQKLPAAKQTALRGRSRPRNTFHGSENSWMHPDAVVFNRQRAEAQAQGVGRSAVLVGQQNSLTRQTGGAAAHRRSGAQPDLAHEAKSRDQHVARESYQRMTLDRRTSASMASSGTGSSRFTLTDLDLEPSKHQPSQKGPQSQPPNTGGTRQPRTIFRT